MTGYKYNGTGTTMTPQQVEDHLAKVRAQIAATPRSGAHEGATSALATSAQARDAASKPPRVIPGEVVQGQPVIRELRQPPPAPQLKGAVKVAEFPERSKYPFKQIADDGGVWQIDPAVFKVSPGAVVQAARKWAEGRILKIKVTTDDGMVYVQFTPAGDQ